MEENSYKSIQKLGNFDIGIVKKIFDDIELNLKQNSLEIINLINEDNNTYTERTSYEEMLKIVNEVASEKWCLEKSSSRSIVDGVGNLGAMCNCNVYVFFYLCLKTLKTHNNITFFETKELHKTHLYLLETIKQSIKNLNYTASIKLVQLDKINDICNYENEVDKYICVGEEEIYTALRTYTDKEIIYSAYGTISVYMDDKTLKNQLLELDDYVFENDLKLDFYTEADVNNVLNSINAKIKNFCCVIYSKDIEKVKVFIKNVRSDLIFVNKNPFKEYKFEIDDVNLIQVKKVFI